MAIVLCDVDGPVANLHEAWLNNYNRDYGDDLTPDDITDWDMRKFVVEGARERIYSYLNSTIYNSVSAVPDALSGVEELRSKYRVVFVTSAPEGTGDAKYRWLKHHMFLDDKGEYGDGRVNLDYIEAHDKSMVRGDILIDDRPENIESFPGRTILWDAPYNRDFQHPYRAHNWKEVLALVDELFALTDDQVRGAIKNAIEHLDYRTTQVEVGYRELHPTEVRCPQQAKAFREIIEQMYQLHLSKNADYSPANILGVGTIGVVVRAWDKMARLLNLHGFRMDAKLIEYVGEQPAKHESIDDSWRDLANYAVIALLVRMGVWGR